MRCLSCDEALSDREATRRFAVSKQFVDLCDNCIRYLPEDLEILENGQLSNDITEET